MLHPNPPEPTGSSTGGGNQRNKCLKQGRGLGLCGAAQHSAGQIAQTRRHGGAERRDVKRCGGARRRDNLCRARGKQRHDDGAMPGQNGAGGIGQVLFDSINAFDFRVVSDIVIIVVVAVTLIDLLSQAMR